MSETVEDYGRVADRALELGCCSPTAFAILPENFLTADSRQALLFGSEASTIRKLLKHHSVPVGDLLPAGERAGSIHNKHFEWAPLLFISAAMVSENPHAISIALGVISNYATDFFRGLPRQKVKLSIVIERKKDRECKKLNYEGDIEGLRSLEKTIRKIADDEREF